MTVSSIHGVRLAGPAMTPSTFNGALLPVGGTELLVVCVRPWVLQDADEARLFLFAFTTRFARPVVLMAQDARGAPSYVGPRRFVEAVAKLPVGVIPWKRYAFRAPAPSGRPRHRYLIPIPPEREPGEVTAPAGNRDRDRR